MTNTLKNNAEGQHTQAPEEETVKPKQNGSEGAAEARSEAVSQQQAPAAEPAAQEGSAADGAESAPSTVKELEQRIAELQLAADEHKENWLRATADFRNLKRRTEQERAELIKNASASLILKLLPIVDDLERAMEHMPQQVAENPWSEGVRLMQRKLQMILEGEGLRPIEAVGQEFDPLQHEAVMYEEVSEELGGKVIAELRKGYKLGDRVLRPTMVKVGRA